MLSAATTLALWLLVACVGCVLMLGVEIWGRK